MGFLKYLVFPCWYNMLYLFFVGLVLAGSVCFIALQNNNKTAKEISSIIGCYVVPIIFFVLNLVNLIALIVSTKFEFLSLAICYVIALCFWAFWLYVTRGFRQRRLRTNNYYGAKRIAE